MIWIIALCSIAIAYADFLCIRRIVDCRSRKFKVIISILWVIDLMPLIFSAICFLLTSDNPTWLGIVSGWINFIYMIAVIAHAPLSIAIATTSHKWIWCLGGVVMGIAIWIFFYSMIKTRTDYQIKRVVIESSNLPKEFDGYRIVQISDLHIGTMLDAEKEIEEIAEICNSLQPDMIAFTGDLVNIRYSEVNKPIFRALQKFKYKDKLYSVLGNHDIGTYIKDSISLTPEANTERLIEVQNRLGWSVLDNQTDYIKLGNDSIAITGISFPKAMHKKQHSSDIVEIGLEEIYATVPKNIFNITLSHIPKLWDNILATYPADLTLAGHVHAMQMAVKIGNWRLSPSRLLYKRWSGLYDQNGYYLYINDGIGYAMYPMRVGARPEITLLELKSRK